MSFKGLKKSIVRAPQNIRQKLNMGEATVDPVYADAERRFKELEVETKKLSEESKRYFNAVNGMLDHQIEFSKAIEEIYKPISGRLSDPNFAVPEDNPQGIEASEQYQAVVKDLKDTLKPDLDLIETRIVGPATELLKIIDNIRKVSVKREHKRVDLDRHLRSHKKLADKKERTPKEEEKMYGTEAEVQVAQQEYDFYNDMMKTELPIMFQMQLDFVKPLFVSFYYMQLNIFYTLYQRMEELKIPYFDLSSDIVEAYNLKKGNVEEQTDAIGITHFKVGHAKSKLDAVKRRQAMMTGADPATGAPGVAPGAVPGQAPLPTYQTGYGQQPPTYGDVKSATADGYPQPYGEKNPAMLGQPQAYGSPQPNAYGATPAAYGSPQPNAYGTPAAAYGSPQPRAQPQFQAQPQAYNPQTPASTVNSAVPPTYQTPAAAPPQVMTPAPSAGMPTCVALYDYTAQAQGDLTFTAGAVIEVIDRTADANGWWTGRYNGVTGVFPGNYVQLQ